MYNGALGTPFLSFLEKKPPNISFTLVQIYLFSWFVICSCFLNVKIYKQSKIVKISCFLNVKNKKFGDYFSKKDKNGIPGRSILHYYKEPKVAMIHFSLPSVILIAQWQKSWKYEKKSMNIDIKIISYLQKNIFCYRENFFADFPWFIAFKNFPEFPWEALILMWFSSFPWFSRSAGTRSFSCTGLFHYPGFLRSFFSEGS